MKKYKVLFLFIISVTNLICQDNNVIYSGKVTDFNKQPLAQVHIVSKGTDFGTQTDIEGNYSIAVFVGDTLLFSHIGMQTLEVPLSSIPSTLNVSMKAKDTKLEEVIVEAKKNRRTQSTLLAEYPTNKNLIKTSNGILDKDRSSSSMHIIQGEDLITFGTDFLYSLKNLHPTLRVVRPPEDILNPLVYLRRLSFSEGVDPPTAIFDLDGFIQEKVPTFLSANEIERIAILERNAALTRYGSKGAGGVIVINTKTQTWQDDLGVKRKYDNRALVDSLTNGITSIKSYRDSVPAFIAKLQATKTEKQASSLYARQKQKYFDKPHYFLEAYDFFLSRWAKSRISEDIGRYLKENFSKNVPVLKALAYLHEKYGIHDIALSIYLDILKLRSANPQSHRDVANAYAQNGDLTSALVRYTRYKKAVGELTENRFDDYGKDHLMTTEINNILKQTKKISEATEDKSTRIVFEWNNPESVMEFQFVTPDGFYDNWSNRVRLDEVENTEKVEEYSSKDFFLDSENKGLWKININYKSGLFEIPTYLKVTVYYDYGLESQSFEVKVYKFSKKQYEMVQLFNIPQN